MCKVNLRLNHADVAKHKICTVHIRVMELKECTKHFCYSENSRAIERASSGEDRDKVKSNKT